jgi:hypothetical protein
MVAPADTSLMSEASLHDPGKELAVLEAEEVRVSEERRRLHQQIDNGFGTELTRARERILSRRRRELHTRIDALRVQVGREVGPRASQEAAELEKVWPALGSAPADGEA